MKRRLVLLVAAVFALSLFAAVARENQVSSEGEVRVMVTLKVNGKLQQVDVSQEDREDGRHTSGRVPREAR
jgi:hypothetical protein